MHSCDCGLHYVVGDPKDEERHRRVHGDYASGPDIPDLAHARELGPLRDFQLLLVDCSVPQAARSRIARVAMVAQRSMPRYPAGYDGTITEDDQRLYILANGSRAVAFVLTAFGERFWRLRWAPSEKFSLVDKAARTERTATVGRVWVAGDNRRSGLAKELLSATGRHLSVEVAAVGWELPFTSAGRALVRSFCPDEFWGNCDVTTLRELLD
jgi:hypothetical protein